MISIKPSTWAELPRWIVLGGHAIAMAAAAVALEPLAAALVVAGLAVSSLHQLRSGPSSPAGAATGRILAPWLVVLRSDKARADGAVVFNPDAESLRPLRRALRWPPSGGAT